MKSSTLSARLAERAQHPRQKNQNRAVFLALRDEIHDALNDEWSVKDIWSTLREEGKIEFSYPAFIRYVNRLIKKIDSKPQVDRPEPEKPQRAELTVPEKPQKTTAIKPANSTKKPLETPKPQAVTSDTIKGFNYNPTLLTMDDLIPDDNGD